MLYTCHRCNCSVVAREPAELKFSKAASIPLFHNESCRARWRVCRFRNSRRSPRTCLPAHLLNRFQASAFPTRSQKCMPNTLYSSRMLETQFAFLEGQPNFPLLVYYSGSHLPPSPRFACYNKRSSGNLITCCDTCDLIMRTHLMKRRRYGRLVSRESVMGCCVSICTVTLVTQVNRVT